LKIPARIILKKYKISIAKQIRKPNKIFGSKIMFNMAQKNLYLPKRNLIYLRILSARLTKIKARLIGTTTITVPKTKLFKKAYKDDVIWQNSFILIV
jgi:hypothetical protein